MKIKKEKIDITSDFLYSKKDKILHIDTTQLTHKLGGKVIYMNNSDIDNQDLGNLGAIPSDRFDPYDTDYICLSEKTIDLLMFGVKDDSILEIESIYRNSKREQFTYKFILENNLKDFIKFRKEEEEKLINS